MLNVSTDVVQNLMEAGYLAAGRGLTPLAERIFAGVEAARPNSEAPTIGRAVALMNSGDAAAAVELLRGTVKKHPESVAAKSFLGLALQLAGRNSESQQVLLEAAATTSDPTAAAMAEAILNPADE